MKDINLAIQEVLDELSALPNAEFNKLLQESYDGEYSHILNSIGTFGAREDENSLLAEEPSYASRVNENINYNEVILGSSYWPTTKQTFELPSPYVFNNWVSSIDPIIVPVNYFEIGSSILPNSFPDLIVDTKSLTLPFIHVFNSYFGTVSIEHPAIVTQQELNVSYNIVNNTTCENDDEEPWAIAA